MRGTLTRPLPPPPPVAPAPLSREAVAAIQIQAVVRRWLALRRIRRLRRRVHAVLELLETEEQYVSRLRKFQDIFFVAIREAQQQSLINVGDVSAIMSNWDDLTTYNTELLRQLRARCGSHFRGSHSVGDILLGMR